MDSNVTHTGGSHDQTITNINDLLTLIGSGITMGAVVFAVILYGHYRHLHSIGNHLFMFGILAMNFVASANYFLCIFTMDTTTLETQRFSRTRCDICGFVEQIHSFVEPFLSTMFWIQILCTVHKWDCPLFRSPRHIALLVAASWFVGIVTASAALIPWDGDGSWYRQGLQAWCWLRDDAELLWFRISFCWLWVATAALALASAMGRPLASDTLNTTQKHLLRRRALLGVVWLFVTALDINARFLSDAPASIVQAAAEPLKGTLNVVAFLYSERMMTFRALGLPPGGEPPYGFTAAMKYIPEKLAAVYSDESRSLV